MTKITQKWYIGLIILPIIINLLTSLFDFPVLLRNWNFTVIGTLIIIVAILIYEYHLLKNENKLLRITPKESDKKIIRKLLDILDINMFQDKICEQSCWYGYEKEAIHKTIKFCEKTQLIKYKTSDEKLNILIQDLRNAIKEFEEQATKILYSDNDSSYSPDKKTEFNVNRTKEIYPIVDEKSGIAFKKLEVLLSYLKQRNYFE